nr:PREDICTED: natural killer cell receptor 2B4-like [Struthio camelus australis]
MELPGTRCHQPALPQQVLLCFMLLAAAGEGCKDIVAAVGGELWLVPEEPSLLWESITWRVRLDKGERLRILTAKSSSVERPPVSRFSQRAIFHRGTLSLQISLVTEADSGVYAAHFENASSFEITSCFCVSVLAPVGQPVLDARVVLREHSLCSLLLACAVPGTHNVTYRWSRASAAGAVGHQSSLQLQLRKDANHTVYHCNASNAVSWATASTDVAALCSPPGLLPTELWWALAAALGLVLAISAALITWRCRRRRGPAGNAEQPLTIYEEVGNAQRSRDHNGSSEAARVGNTIYTTICSKTPGPSCPREPESHTIYSVVQPSKRSPSVKRKRLEPALTSTAYTEVMDPQGDEPSTSLPGPPGANMVLLLILRAACFAETSRRWRSLPQTSPPAPVGHHLS